MVVGPLGRLLRVVDRHIRQISEAKLLDNIVVNAYIVAHDYFLHTEHPRDDRPHRDRHRRQQWHRTRRRPSARREGRAVVLAVRNTDKGHAAAAQMTGTTEVRRLDLASLGSINEFAAGWDGEIDLLINNAGIMIPPQIADRRRLRAAVRNQPPRPLRPHQSPARAHHRSGGDGLLLGPPLRRDRLRRFAVGAATLQGMARLRAVKAGQPAVHRRTAAQADRVGSSVKATAAHPGYAATNLQFHSENRAMDALNIATASSLRTKTAGRYRPCTPRSPMSPATASPDHLASWSGVAEPSW